ncbi:hypothetical protein, partial [Odoribacter splanchnicus]
GTKSIYNYLSSNYKIDNFIVTKSGKNKSVCPFRIIPNGSGKSVHDDVPPHVPSTCHRHEQMKSPRRHQNTLSLIADSYLC